jgi:hypothetical protein
MWIMTSKRVPGSSLGPPHQIFRIGSVKVATITMWRAQTRDDWSFILVFADGETNGEPHRSFGEAMHAMHAALNAPSPEGYNR